MAVVYEAANGVEAHMILHLLQQAGIEGKIGGELLQGAMGEIPATGNVRVQVDTANVDEARSIIAEWESIQTDETAYPRKGPSSPTGAYLSE